MLAIGTVMQGRAAFGLTEAVGGFGRAPGALSGLRLLDTVAGVVGIDRISGRLAHYAVKLALQGDQASLHAAQDMVDLMRARVPQDSGLLWNGIDSRRAGGFTIVEARADHAGYDYALAVEAGHHAGGLHADADLFADTTGQGGRSADASPATAVPGQPFFYDTAREVLADWRRALEAGIGAAARGDGW